jgi:hypothetical protein
MVTVLIGKSERLRYEVQYWACRLSWGWCCRRRWFYRLFETSLRLHCYPRATVLTDLASRRLSVSADVQSMQCTLAFRSGNLVTAFNLLASRLQDEDYRAVERLLFRTGSRPQGEQDRLKVLDQLSRLPELLESHRCYALIAQSYLVLKLEEKSLAMSLLGQVHPLVQSLSADSTVYGCSGSNRRNRAKLLVSLCTTAYHLALMLGDDDALAWVWAEVMAVASRLRYADLNADACLRMSSNLSRCLAVGALLLNNNQLDTLMLSLDAVRGVNTEICRYCLIPSGEGVSKTQENHLGLMAQLEKNMVKLMSDSPTDRETGIRRLSQLLNHSSSRSLDVLIAKRLRQCHGTHS